eukprot:2183327-Rhodomonas_salina.1
MGRNTLEVRQLLLQHPSPPRRLRSVSSHQCSATALRLSFLAVVAIALRRSWSLSALTLSVLSLLVISSLISASRAAAASDVDSSLASWQPQKLPNGKIQAFKFLSAAPPPPSFMTSTDVIVCGPVQYTDPLGVYIMLPSDLALLQDPKFTPWVDLYARNSPAFFQDFAKAYSKLLALGT